MKKKKLVKFFVLVIVICVSVLLITAISNYCKMQDSLKYFEMFYTKDDLVILKDNIKSKHETISSGDYKISLKGLWAQENCASFIFEIENKIGSTIDEKEIQYSIESKEIINEENGDLSLGSQTYKEGSEGNGMLELKYLSENNYKNYIVKIGIEKEIFVFEISIGENEKMKHFIPVEDGYTYQDIYLTPMSIYTTIEKDNTNISEFEMSISYIDGMNLTMMVGNEFVSADDNTGQIKRYLQFLDKVYDIKQVETISVGEMKYKNIED